MRVVSRILVVLATAVPVAGLTVGCTETEVPLAKEAPKVNVAPPPEALTKKKEADGKGSRPTGGSGDIDISTYGSQK